VKPTISSTTSNTDSDPAKTGQNERRRGALVPGGSGNGAEGGGGGGGGAGGAAGCSVESSPVAMQARLPRARDNAGSGARAASQLVPTVVEEALDEATSVKNRSTKRRASRA
jgi:hypothetical protein